MTTWLQQAAGDGARDRQAARARGRIRADVVYLGWQHVDAGPDPGLPPCTAGARAGRRQPGLAGRATARAPAAGTASPADRDGGSRDFGGGRGPPGALVTWPAVSPRWRLFWRPEQRRVSGLAGLAGERDLAAQFRDEELRVARFRAVQRSEYAGRQQEYAAQYRHWRDRAASARRQAHWYPVTVPTATHRIDIAGGTLAGWSALLTMLAAPRLAVGGEVTVVDLTEGGVAADLLAVARRSGIDPLVWVLPADLPRLELGTQLSTDLLADVLARTISAADGAAGPASRRARRGGPGRGRGAASPHPARARRRACVASSRVAGRRVASSHAVASAARRAADCRAARTRPDRRPGRSLALYRADASAVGRARAAWPAGAPSTWWWSEPGRWSRACRCWRRSRRIWPAGRRAASRWPGWTGVPPRPATA